MRFSGWRRVVRSRRSGGPTKAIVKHRKGLGQSARFRTKGKELLFVFLSFKKFETQETEKSKTIGYLTGTIFFFLNNIKKNKKKN